MKNVKKNQKTKSTDLKIFDSKSATIQSKDDNIKRSRSLTKSNAIYEQFSLSAEGTLTFMINYLTHSLNELNEASALKSKKGKYNDNLEFILGEKTAFVECLEIIKSWKSATENGLDFDIEERYPIK